ncbi:magnesium transporter MRS2-3-like isoform X2 [Lotus japonicus]|uniref:magnesium transporter MRS2-3-like isoform X2 n=1 Tax=Lotus japonicus TaxID=34305 RepID=UPI00258F8920|nr:magnesium transporter MRS2-3-like isoform X2 [Lotus japonicus]
MNLQGGGDGEGEAEIQEDSSTKILPFEFVALEACIESVCSALENETQILEQEAHNALDKLTTKISTLNLEYVRQIKSRLVALTSRAQRVKDEIENLLDDDDDMAELFLTDKLAQHHYPNSSVSSINNADDVENLQVPQPDINDRTPPEISLERGGDSTSDHEDEQNGADEYSSGQIFGAGSEIHESQAGNTNSASVSNKNRNVEDLEMLLGAYFVQIGGTVNKLSALAEYVGDTEDYININLDDKQNRILETGVKVGTASVLLNAFIVVTGVLGMNIHIKLFETGLPQFLSVVFGCTAACIFLYVVAMAWYKHKRLLE